MRIRSIALSIVCLCAFSASKSYAGTLVVTTTADSGAGSLRDTIAAASPGDTVQFAAVLNGQTITLTTAQLEINTDLTISGPGADQLTVERSSESDTPEFRVFLINPYHTVTIGGMTVTGGFLSTRAGGAMYNYGATVTINNCTISNNFAAHGGAIFNNAMHTGSADLTINESTLVGNSTTTKASGGAIYNYASGPSVYGSVSLNNSTVSGNFAAYGGGIMNDGYNEGSAFFVINSCTISGNSAKQDGGGIYNYGVFSVNALVWITNSTISGNSALQLGGAVMNNGAKGQALLSVGTSTFSGNSALVGGGIYNDTYPFATSARCNRAHAVGAKCSDQFPLQPLGTYLWNTLLKAGASGENIYYYRGTVSSSGYNLSSDYGGGVLTATGDQTDTDPMIGPLSDHGGPTLTHGLLAGSPAINAGDPTFTPPPEFDQRGPGFPRVLGGRIDIGSVEAKTTAQFPPRLLNISTRLRVLSGDNALIGGFIVRGTTSKRVIVRAIGPSLTQFGVPDALVDPTLELHGPNGFSTITNDNWRDTQQAEIEATGLAPSDNLESALVAFLPPGAYTAVLRGINDGIGVGLVEAYDLDPGVNAELANISTRGFVDSGDNAMIGGFILSSGSTNATVLVRGIGPSLKAFGVPDPLGDPSLELHDSNGAEIGMNDDWRETQEVEIEETGLAPTDDFESAILQDFSPGAYTAIVRGKNGTTGVALVEAYQLAGGLKSTH